MRGDDRAPHAGTQDHRVRPNHARRGGHAAQPAVMDVHAGHLGRTEHRDAPDGQHLEQRGDGDGRVRQAIGWHVQAGQHGRRRQ